MVKIYWGFFKENADALWKMNAQKLSAKNLTGDRARILLPKCQYVTDVRVSHFPTCSISKVRCCYSSVSAVASAGFFSFLGLFFAGSGSDCLGFG